MLAGMSASYFKLDHRSPARIASALPDGLTAAFFLMVWLTPLSFGNDMVKTAILIMLIEFITVHAGGFIGGLSMNLSLSRAKRALLVLVLGLFYSGFVAAFVFAFDQWWPLAVFGWLLLSKFSRVLFGASTPREEAEGQLLLWVVSVMFYVLGVMLTVFLPLPRLGVTEAVLPQLGLPGTGLWVEQPHRLLAFGMLYFAALALLKLNLDALSAPRR